MASLNSKKIFSAPDWAQKELDEVEKTVQGWSRSDRLEAFARGGGDVVRALKKFPQSMWGFTAKKGNWWIACDPISRSGIPSFIVSRAAERSVQIDPSAAELIIEVAGTDLAALVDAVGAAGLAQRLEQRDVVVVDH